MKNFIFNSQQICMRRKTGIISESEVKKMRIRYPPQADKFRGGSEFQTDGVAVTAPAGILQYFEDLERGTNPAAAGGQ
jgi:hypothetical protein